MPEARPKRLSLWKRDSPCEQDAAAGAWCPCGLAEGRASYLDAAAVEPGVLAGGAHHGGVGEAVLHHLHADDARGVPLLQRLHALLRAVLPAEGAA